MVKRRWDSTDSQTLIERFDSKNSTHITAFVAIIFGAFTVLTFLQGKGFPPSETSVWYLFFVEIAIFPLAIFYCLCRSFYYSMCVEKVKEHSELQLMEQEVSSDSLNAIPFIAKKIARFRLEKVNNKIITYIFIPLVYFIWLGIILAVLNLPIPTT